MPLQKKKKKDRALLAKLLSERQQNLVVLREYRRLKDQRKGSILRIGLRKMIRKFKETGDLSCAARKRTETG
ncbi:hypothetical protein TNCV_3400431 [Trichonephila clavipes]|nr:hypothetical protein TNCV_3400431 [Trichonephila clavipes]